MDGTRSRLKLGRGESAGVSAALTTGLPGAGVADADAAFDVSFSAFPFFLRCASWKQC